MPKRLWTKTDLEQAVKNSQTISNVARLLNLNPRCVSTLRRIREQIQKCGIDGSHFPAKGERCRSWTKEQLADAIQKSTNWSAVLKAISLNNRGSNYQTLKSAAKRYGFSTMHFIQISREDVLKRNREERQLPIDKILVKDSDYYGHSLFRRLLKEKLIEEKCSKCGLGNMWQSEPIRLQIDHINGDRHDNRRENLQVLCPNCHSQTKTWGGRNQRLS